MSIAGVGSFTRYQYKCFSNLVFFSKTITDLGKFDCELNRISADVCMEYTNFANARKYYRHAEFTKKY